MPSSQEGLLVLHDKAFGMPPGWGMMTRRDYQTHGIEPKLRGSGPGSACILRRSVGLARLPMIGDDLIVEPARNAVNSQCLAQATGMPID